MKLNGREIVLQKNGTVIGEIVSQSLNYDRNEIETSSKDSGEDSEFIGGRSNWAIDVTCRLDPADTAGQGDVEADALTHATDTYTFGKETPATGDVSYSGTAFPTNVSVQADDEGAAEISFTLRGTGALTRSVAV
mgnify:CR=1 FL=1